LIDDLFSYSDWKESHFHHGEKMKYIAILALSLISFNSFAGSTICAGPSVHYSSVFGDFGAEPPKGMVIGGVFLSINGELKAKETRISRMASVGSFDLELSFTNNVSLAGDGNQLKGSSVYSANIQVVDPTALVPLIENEPVICKTTWLMAP
jgi:hypothetical protein